MVQEGRLVYPLSAIVGQKRMLTGLILVAINPKLSGILIQGAKGTAKSTAVRALAALLPEIEVVRGCHYSCDPDNYGGLCQNCLEYLAKGQCLPKTFRRVRIVDLPLSITEDRLVGSLDLSHAVMFGRRKFEPGLLARANRGIIYLDEVNLADYQIVNTLLNVATARINIVEREGLSYTHAAQFILMGTMNPEEGELRPQLLDRFGLCVTTNGVQDPALRVEIIKRRERFEANPLGFYQSWAAAEAALRKRILTAWCLLPRVIVQAPLLDLIVKLSVKSRASGHRADILIAATASTIAAWNGRTKVTGEDVFEAAEYVLTHRGRITPADAIADEGAKTNERQKDAQGQEGAGLSGSSHPSNANISSYLTGPTSQSSGLNNTTSQPVLHRMVKDLIQPFQVKFIAPERDRMMRNGSGRRLTTKTLLKSGRYVRSTLQRRNNDLAFDATIRAAAPYQVYRTRKNTAIAIEPVDIREKVREKRVNNLLLFVVDASGSMVAQRRMVEARSAILSLLVDAYQKRDKIGLVSFRGHAADILLPPTNSVKLGQKLLQELPIGGMTPLSAGLLKAYEVAKTSLRKTPFLAPIIIIITDGKGNVSMGKEKPLVEALNVAQIIAAEHKIKSVIIDIEKAHSVSFGVAQVMAGVMGADYYKFDHLKADDLVQTVKLACR